MSVILIFALFVLGKGKKGHRLVIILLLQSLMLLMNIIRLLNTYFIKKTVKTLMTQIGIRCVFLTLENQDGFYLYIMHISPKFKQQHNVSKPEH